MKYMNHVISYPTDKWRNTLPEVKREYEKHDENRET